MTISSTTLRSAAFVLTAIAAPFAVGCASPATADDAETSESGVIDRVNGSTLGSAYAKKNVTYLSKRNVGLLRDVGALTPEVASLAERVDGIIANQVADGRVSLQELLRVESPEIIGTLFPEEKAALPKLWELLETTANAPKNTTPLGALPVIAPEDASTPAGTLTAPTNLVIADLPEALKVAAKRVQLTLDSDKDATTITPADIEAAIAKPQAYTPSEIEQLRAIAKIFNERAVSSIASRAKLPTPFATSKTLSALGGGAKLRVDDSLVLREQRNLWFSSSTYKEGATRVTFSGRVARKVSVDAAPDEKVVAIFEGTEREVILAGDVASLEAGVTTFEVWSNGQRRAVERVKIASDIATVDTSVDLTPWTDYALSAGGAPLFKNVVSAKSRGVYNAGQQWDVEYEYATAAKDLPADADKSALSMVATPLGVVAGRYEVTAGNAGVVRIDVSPTGVVHVTRMATGASMRTYIHSWSDGPKFHAQFPDRFRVLLNGNTGKLTIFFDGNSTLFDAVVSAADRTG